MTPQTSDSGSLSCRLKCRPSVLSLNIEGPDAALDGDGAAYQTLLEHLRRRLEMFFARGLGEMPFEARVHRSLRRLAEQFRGGSEAE